MDGKVKNVGQQMTMQWLAVLDIMILHGEMIKSKIPGR
jgi:hypothetical protein